MSAEWAGRLTQQVMLQQRAGGQDATGGRNGGWLPLGLTWASVVPDGRGPAMQGEVPSAMPRYRIGMWIRGMLVGDRVVWRGKALDVVEVISDPRTPDRVELVTEERR